MLVKKVRFQLIERNLLHVLKADYSSRDKFTI